MHTILPVVVPLVFLALIFGLLTCVGCIDQVKQSLHRLLHARDGARGRHPTAPSS